MGGNEALRWGAGTLGLSCLPPPPPHTTSFLDSRMGGWSVTSVTCSPNHGPEDSLRPPVSGGHRAPLGVCVCGSLFLTRGEPPAHLQGLPPRCSLSVL